MKVKSEAIRRNRDDIIRYLSLYYRFHALHSDHYEERRIIMKKLLCILLACCIFIPGLTGASGANSETDAIVLCLHCSVAGCTCADYEKLIEIQSPQVQFRQWKQKAYPVDIDNAASFSEYEPMTAGRTYYITYYLAAAEGYTLPDALEEGDVVLKCDKGVEVILCGIVDYYSPSGSPRNGTTVRTLRIVAKVVVDSSFFQRIIGWFQDVFLKIRSWQLY